MAINSTKVRKLAEQGLSQYEIARKLNTSRQRVYQVIEAIRSTDPLFKILRHCPHCDKIFEVTFERRVYCSPLCRSKSSWKEPCECGRLKTRGTVRCDKCSEVVNKELEDACAKLYTEGKTAKEISAIVHRSQRTCLGLARKGGAEIRRRGPRKKNLD